MLIFYFQSGQTQTAFPVGQLDAVFQDLSNGASRKFIIHSLRQKSEGFGTPIFVSHARHKSLRLRRVDKKRNNVASV